MNESLANIFQFLEQFEPQATGHSHEPLDPGLRTKAVAFARGELPLAEHAPFIAQLQSDPRLVSILTETVKGMRAQAGSKK